MSAPPFEEPAFGLVGGMSARDVVAAFEEAGAIVLPDDAGPGPRGEELIKAAGGGRIARLDSAIAELFHDQLVRVVLFVPEELGEGELRALFGDGPRAAPGQLAWLRPGAQVTARQRPSIPGWQIEVRFYDAAVAAGLLTAEFVDRELADWERAEEGEA